MELYKIWKLWDGLIEILRDKKENKCIVLDDGEFVEEIERSKAIDKILELEVESRSQWFLNWDTIKEALWE